MNITRVSVKHVRSHEATTIDLSTNTTILVGKNGAGKTSLVEAIYIALQGSSFKGSDSDILQHGAPWYRIELHTDDSKRIVTFDPARPSGKKKFTINDKVSYRLSPQDKYPVVLFEPDDLRLLQGSPARRRQFIDHFITQIDPSYSSVIRKYERALKQRNTLLKHPRVKNEDLFVWNVALSDYGAQIIDRRIYAIELLNTHLSDNYQAIAQNNNDTVTAHYSHTLIHNTAQKLLRELEQSTKHDTQRGYTGVGPHRHDMVITFNAKPANTVASRGENRSIIIALKFLELEIIKNHTGNSPILLLDDVFSELDKDRQRRLMKNTTQTIITTTVTPDSFNKGVIHIQ